MTPTPSTHTLIWPTSWGGNCFELTSLGTPPSQGLPLDPGMGLDFPNWPQVPCLHILHSLP